MKNKITVSIAGQEYTMVAEEAESYVPPGPVRRRGAGRHEHR